MSARKHTANYEFQPASRQEWREWLKKNHSTAEEVWLVYFKKHTGKPTVTYKESVEEAICFGWIDGLKKKIDDERYTHRFTPRKQGSRWSSRNTEWAQELIEQGKMTRAGLDVFEQGKRYDEAYLRSKAAEEIYLPQEIEKALKAHETAWTSFNNLAPGYKRQYLNWLLSAKKQETREKRLAEAIALLSKNKKLGMK